MLHSGSIPANRGSAAGRVGKIPGQRIARSALHPNDTTAIHPTPPSSLPTHSSQRATTLTSPHPFTPPTQPSLHTQPGAVHEVTTREMSGPNMRTSHLPHRRLSWGSLCCALSLSLHINCLAGNAFFVALRGLRSHFHTSRRQLRHGPPRLRVRLCVPPDPGIRTSASAAPGTRVSATPGTGEAAALGACASAPPGTESTAALHTFTLDSGASRCFFRDRTALEPLARPVAVSLADPSGGPVIATSSTVIPCPAVPSGTLSGLHLPSFSTNLVAGCALQDGGVHLFTPAYERVTHCTCARTGRHLATFTRQPGSDLYTLTTGSPQVTLLCPVCLASHQLPRRKNPNH
ncbi:unnamed protein product [Closterium sp. NIES-53]